MYKKLKKIDLAIIINLLLIFISLAWLGQTSFDWSIQNLFFNFENKTWLIDKNEPIAKFFFYNLPKILLAIAITASLIILLLNYKNKLPELKKYQPQIFIFFLGITLIPLIAGNIKKFTNVYCPTQLEIYDGKYPYVKVLDHYPKNFQQTKKGQCFPAGHAVTGFCLMILFFVFEKRSLRLTGLGFGFFAGWILGWYQIAKGAHFFSDTLVSMLVCFLLALLIARLFNKQI